MSTSQRGPEPLGQALTQWLDRTGLGRRVDLAAAVEDWAERVGPQIAAVTRAEAVTGDGTLLVRVVSHAWATELGLMAPGILARVNGSRKGRILHIRWLVGPLDRPGNFSRGDKHGEGQTG